MAPDRRGFDDMEVPGLGDPMSQEPSPPADGQLANLLDPTDLRSSVRSGLTWNILVSIVLQGSRIVSSLILIRLLQPSDYGVAGMALIVGAFLACFSDLGFGSALIQQRSIDETDRSTVFWTTVAMGVALNAVMIGLAGPIAAFFHQPRLKNLVIVLSFTLVIGSFATTQGSLLERAMKYRAVAIRLMIATVGACATAIAIAAAGGGPWAFVGYQLALTSLVTILLWQLAAWRPRFVYSYKSLKRVAGFGANVVGAGFLGFLQTNTDNILVGRYLGSAALGIYSVAYNVILIPIGRLFAPVGQTLFSAISRIQDQRSRVAGIWIRSVRGVVAVILPTIVGLLIVAPDFVDVVLGKRWHAATTLIRILGFVTIVYGVAMISNSMLTALGRPHVVFRLTLVNTGFAIGAFALGLRWGIVGVAACYAAVTIPINLLGVMLVNRMLGISHSEFLRSISGVAEAALLMAGVCWLTRESLIRVGMSPSPRLAILIGVSIVTYLLGTLWRNRDLIHEVKSFLRPGATVGMHTAN